MTQEYVYLLKLQNEYVVVEEELPLQRTHSAASADTRILESSDGEYSKDMAVTDEAESSSVPDEDASESNF